MIVFALGSIALALGLGYVISWSLIGPVKAIEARLDQIAAGDFTRRVRSRRAATSSAPWRPMSTG